MDMQWIPCSERLPSDSKNVIVTMKFGKLRRVTTAFYRDGMWQKYSLTGSEIYQTKPVTAWMPFPEPYEEETNGMSPLQCKSTPEALRR